jgi:STE24 endopeptidase
MNPWRIAFYAAVALYVVLRGALFAAQHAGNRSPEWRARVERHFGPEDIARGVEYSRRGLAARVAGTALDIALLAVFLGSGLAARLSSWAGRTGGGWPLQALIVAAVLLLVLFAVHLPFSYYFGHVLEKRFGFSTQSAGSWLVLQAKNLGVALVLGSAAALLWFGLLRLFPRGWVLVFPAAFTAFQVAVALLMPLVLVPLYYTKTPLPEGPFRDRVADVARRAGIRVGEIDGIDESRYSKHTNAFFAGVGPTKNIFLYDTLLKFHPQDEVLTVVAHEAGHWRAGHVVKGIVLAAVGLLAGCLLLGWLYPRLAGSGPGAWPPLSDPGSLPALGLLVLIASFFASPVEHAVSRRFEREADRAAIELTGDRRAFIEGERRLALENRSQLLPHPLIVFWYYSHPPAIERIEMGESERL